jgi:predicted HD phosphohydrolase
MLIADEVFIIFADKGQSSYFGEPVSQLEHALQAAHFARHENSPDHLVVAALVHDIDHLVADVQEDIADLGVDAKHEEIGERWLSRRFGPEVNEPVYLHVAAKRTFVRLIMATGLSLVPHPFRAFSSRVGR